MTDDIPKAIEILVRSLNTDITYYQVWKANIAMAFVDEFSKQHVHSGVHKIANDAAIYFLSNLCADNHYVQITKGGKMAKKNPFKAGDRVLVRGYDSTGTYNHDFAGEVVDADDETIKVGLDRGYAARVWFGQARLETGKKTPPDPGDDDTGEEGEPE